MLGSPRHDLSREQFAAHIREAQARGNMLSALRCQRNK